MTSMHFLDSAAASAVLTHLLQSTVFAAVAWLLALALRGYPARVRFWVWMSASLKFLVPFALLTALGARWARPRPQPVHTVFYMVLEQFDRPFAKGTPIAPSPAISPHSMPASLWIATAIAAIWLCGCLVMLLQWTRQWLSARRMVKNALPVADGPELGALRSAEATAIRIVVTSKAVEPGIFGVMRPVLLWPAGLSERLDHAQIRAIVAHELEHVRRRDNLSSAIHSLVEALFWFHPAVYWMRSKMSEERELACDESVVAQSAQPLKYAESILKVCAFCLESPLPCVAGVSGSDLKQRVLRIMKHRPGVTLTPGRRALLAAAGLLTIVLPVGFGVVHGQTGGAADSNTPATGAARNLPKYEVASIKPASSNDGMSRLMLTPDGLNIRGIPLQMVLRQAFGAEDDRIIAAPSWTRSNRYDIDTKVAPEDAPGFEKLKEADRQAMLIPVLQERFNLKYHHETRELPMYALVVAKGGPKLTESKTPPPPVPSDAPNLPGAPKTPMQVGRMMMDPGRIEAQGSPMAMLVHLLAPQLGHTVVDKTGLTGRYDYTLQWTPDNAPPPMIGGPGGPGGSARSEAANDAAPVSLFTAIQEQLGLRLEAEKGNVDVIVIDHLDLPSPN